jgi:tRNA nucleotidyltransferase (CCA-adding enzyme)
MSQKPEIAADIIYAGLLDEFLHKENRHSLSMQPLKTRLAQLALLPLETSLRLCAFCAILLEFELIKQPVLFLRSLRFDTKTIDRCSTGIDIAHELTNESRVSQCQGKVSSGIDLPRKDIKRMLAKHGVEKVRCAMAACDLTYNLKDTNDVFDNIPVGVSLQFLPIADEVIDSGECFSLNELAVNGRDIIELGQKPGVKVGEILNQLLNHVIEHPKDNKREILLAMAKLPGLTD